MKIKKTDNNVSQNTLKRYRWVMRGCLWLCMSILVAGCCSPREAATVGSIIGRPFGYALGTGVVAVEETFNTAADVRNANPRYDQSQYKMPGMCCNNVANEYYSGSQDEAYYYEAQVLVKTIGPAHIDSIELQDTEDVTEFWN